MSYATPANDPALELTAKLFRGFADPSRLALLEALRGGDMSVNQLAEATGLSQPNTSAHLACLRDCGLVLSRQEGRFVYYTVADARTESLLRGAEEILQAVADRVYACTRCGGSKDAIPVLEATRPRLRREAARPSGR